MLSRADLPAAARLTLLDAAVAAIAKTRIVMGALAPKRLERIMRDLTDTGLTEIGESSAAAGEHGYATTLVTAGRISTRLMLHAVVNGQVLFFSSCLAGLAEAAPDKVFTLLESGGRPALNALLARCGLPEAVRNLMVRLIHPRARSKSGGRRHCAAFRGHGADRGAHRRARRCHPTRAGGRL
ncbi:MAG: DUF2336 domain-containing protein [Hyphomicrobium sp.]